jgi:multidrug efflux pump subunit AcrA (membrane-fusion protein)
VNQLTTITAANDADVASSPPMDRHRRPAWQRGAMVLVPIALLGAVGVKMFDHPDAAMAAPPPASVTVASPLVRQVSEWDDYVGRFAPSRTVEIRPRVAGEVTGIHFRDGEIVSKGQLLFTIDSRPFAAALAEAHANVASAKSALSLARTDLGRDQPLRAT